MQERDAYALLVLAAARDNRQVSPEVARVWAADLDGIDPADAVEAMKRHYRDSPGVWMVPGHIVQGVRVLRREREREVRVQRALAGPQPDPERVVALHETLKREGLTPMEWALRAVAEEDGHA